MNKLKEFHDDKQMMEAFMAFVLDELNREALIRVYRQEDTTAIKETKEILEHSFSKLRELYTPKEDRKVTPRGV